MFLVECAAFAEDVDPLCVWGDSIEHGAADFVEVGVWVGTWGYEVCAKEGDVINVCCGDSRG